MTKRTKKQVANGDVILKQDDFKRLMALVEAANPTVASTPVADIPAALQRVADARAKGDLGAFCTAMTHASTLDQNIRKYAWNVGIKGESVASVVAARTEKESKRFGKVTTRRAS